MSEESSAKIIKEMAKNTDKPAAKEEPLMSYEVTAAEIKIGAVIAYRTARVKLTKSKADALLDAMPGSLKLLGLA